MIIVAAMMILAAVTSFRTSHPCLNLGTFGEFHSLLGIFWELFSHMPIFTLNVVNLLDGLMKWK